MIYFIYIFYKSVMYMLVYDEIICRTLFHCIDNDGICNWTKDICSCCNKLKRKEN